MVMMDRKDKHSPFYWEAEISGEELYCFCIWFTKYVEDMIG